MPIEDASGLLGSITLTLPPGRDIRPLERRLLSDIAEQAALALRNARLELELAARVRQLDRHTRELAASRNRIIGAVDTERRRLESSIAVTRPPHDAPTARRCRADRGGGAQAERIEELPRPGDGGGRVPARADAWHLPDEPDALGARPPRCRRRRRRCARVDALRIDPEVAAARFPEHVEAAAYYCCVEVLEHPGGEVTLTLGDDGELVLAIRGVDVDALNRSAIVDRIEACGGVLDVPDAGAASCGSGFPALVPLVRPHLQQACRAERGLGDVRRRPAPGQVEVVLVVGGEQDDDRRGGALP